MNALSRNPYVDRFDVTIFAENGEIILSGEVDTYFEKYEAEDVVSKVPGVVIVDNNLNVDNEAVSNRYFQYDYYGWNNVYPSVYTEFYEDPSQQSDWEIKNNVKSQLWWSPFVNQDEVNVKVDDGIVTLDGTVDTFQEKAAASKNAYEGGAIDVKNKLQVRQQPEE
jgi:osmotically-inducible protein OsmY